MTPAFGVYHTVSVTAPNGAVRVASLAVRVEEFNIEELLDGAAVQGSEFLRFVCWRTMASDTVEVNDRLTLNDAVWTIESKTPIESFRRIAFVARRATRR